MIGLNAVSGRTITGTEHLVQSISDILLTPLGSRIERRDYGSMLIDLIDWPHNVGTRVQAYAAIATALMRWEPRLQLTRVQLSLDDMSGTTYIDLEGLRLDTNESQNLRIPLKLGASA